VTTDYPAVQRALETRCEAILVAKHGVDGVYTGDPRHDSTAVRYASMDYEEVIRRDLKVMDQPALMLAKEHNMPMHVFDFDRPGSILSIVTGESVGTYLGNGVPVTLAAS
jgi:uridylate kinase